jgi:hypothetical protein
MQRTAEGYDRHNYKERLEGVSIRIYGYTQNTKNDTIYVRNVDQKRAT